MTALRAKLYEPPVAERPRRNLSEMIRALIDEKALGWPELRQGERGTDVSFVLLRDLSTASSAVGGYLVDTKQPKNSIEYLHSRLVCARAGAQTIPVDGFHAIPRVDNPGAAYWIQEGIAPTETNLTFGQISPSMKIIAANVDYTRGLRVATGPLVEETVTRELFALLAAGVDKAALCGTGADGQPIGIVNDADVDTRSGAAFATATGTAMLKVVEDGNADPTAWIMATDAAELLRRRALNGTGSGFLIDGAGRMLNLPVYVSSGVDAGTIILGDFRELAILSRSLEIVANPANKTGITEVTAFHYVDAYIRHAAAFAVATGVS